ncbi:recombinase RecT [uncultured Slackia sp.]|uniref:recombinase RecT n=1 Tax=uncultured Slackia sp. TaxID=665903 RepID=UPI0025F15E8B|nr:recombinase RecT [uncultured Slackia sp.]
MGELATKAAQVQAVQTAGSPKGMAAMLEKAWPRIEAVLPEGMSRKRFYQTSLSLINRTPKLGLCDSASVCSCLMSCSALGLEPSVVDGLGRAYILPYKTKTGMHAQMIIGYKGMLDLARRSGQIRSISARAVYEGDEFRYSFGLEESLTHVPSGREHEAGEKPTHVYMVAHFTDGGHYMDVMSLQDVEAIRKRSKAATSGPWVTDYEAMAKKTVIRRAFPYLPVSVTAQQSVSADESDGGFVDMLTREPVIEPQPVEAAEQPGEQAPATRYAVCQGCGTVVEGVTADATPQDFEGAGCCGNPSYIIQEG